MLAFISISICATSVTSLSFPPACLSHLGNRGDTGSGIVGGPWQFPILSPHQAAQGRETDYMGQRGQGFAIPSTTATREHAGLGQDTVLSPTPTRQARFWGPLKSNSEPGISESGVEDRVPFGVAMPLERNQGQS